VGSVTVPAMLPELPTDCAPAGGLNWKTEKSAMQRKIAALRRHVRINDLR
jgi:hypothetical protein